MSSSGRRLTIVFLWTSTFIAASVIAFRPAAVQSELSNRLPEAAPYVMAEARSFPPPFEAYWESLNSPAQCQACHERIYQEWNGSMMANAWRDPAWRAAFLLLARQTSTHGNCDAPDPPDGSPRAELNPFARHDECASTFDAASRPLHVSHPGSLVDGFCAQCHMPSNYVDNVPLHSASTDPVTGLEDARLNPQFHPTSDANTGLAFAKLDAELRNTDSGKHGVFCAVCHAIGETRNRPFGSHVRWGPSVYKAAVGSAPRGVLLPQLQGDILRVPDPTKGNLGYAVGSGSFRLSPHAIALGERFGPLTARPPGERDVYQEEVFDRPRPPESLAGSKHPGFRHVLQTRAELCGGCHDVSNPLPIRNVLGKWVSGFPIERTYTEWATSRYADRPGNFFFDPRFKRDCQTCHMQQDFGKPGTAQTLYVRGVSVPPLLGPVATDGPERTYFSHHFVGGNTYVPGMIGAAVDQAGSVERYPELSIFSFTSADKRSPYANAFWTNIGDRGPQTQHARLAWDRLRNVLDLQLVTPQEVVPGTQAPISIHLTNSGSGHNFPTGFPEGRIAWLGVHAYDLGTTKELEVADSEWKRTSTGVGGLTPTDMIDPNYPGCNWPLPAGSPDPYSVQFKAVASLGDGCPTLDLLYAHPLNVVVNEDGLLVNNRGTIIDRSKPLGAPQFVDRDRDGDLFDDAFLRDSRLRPLPHAGATVGLDRYSIVIPPDVVGPIAVVATVYYQSIEAMVAMKLLGNMADTDQDRRLEPCVLGGACDNRFPTAEPAVVEGAPPTPLVVRSATIRVAGAPADRVVPVVTTYPAAGAANVSGDVVVKASFSEPVTGVSAATFTLSDGGGRLVAASVDQIGDGTWGLFPDALFLRGGEEYTARVAPGICDGDGNCTTRAVAWSFRISTGKTATTDTRMPVGFKTGPPGSSLPVTR
jgi:hypothetical protein